MPAPCQHPVGDVMATYQRHGERAPLGVADTGSTTCPANAVGLTALVAAAARDDQVAWTELVHRFTGLLWAIARRYRLDDASAADAVQTTWLRLVDHLDRIDDPERLPGWLGTTMRHECLHILRLSGREEISATTQLRLDAVPSSDRPLDAGLLENERDVALWRAFGAMGEHCQQLLRALMATPPPSYATVSAALGLPVGSIGPTRQRCLRRLREVVSHDTTLGERP